MMEQEMLKDAADTIWSQSYRQSRDARLVEMTARCLQDIHFLAAGQSARRYLLWLEGGPLAIVSDFPENISTSLYHVLIVTTALRSGSSREISLSLSSISVLHLPPCLSHNRFVTDKTNGHDSSRIQGLDMRTDVLGKPMLF
jgi:hypothetical protein